MANRKEAFTIIESMVTLVVIGVIAVFTIASTINMEKLNLSKISTLSKIFYSEAKSTYAQILYNETKDNNILSIDALKNIEMEELPPEASAEEKEEAKEDYVKEQSTVLFELFQEYLPIHHISCQSAFPNAFINEDEITALFLKKGNTCFVTEKNLIVILRFNKECNENYYTIPYYKENSTPIERPACGFLAYGTKNSRLELGRDFFVIGLKKRKAE